jgi:hypothetical protein
MRLSYPARRRGRTRSLDRRVGKLVGERPVQSEGAEPEEVDAVVDAAASDDPEPEPAAESPEESPDAGPELPGEASPPDDDPPERLSFL